MKNIQNTQTFVMCLNKFSYHNTVPVIRSAIMRELRMQVNTDLPQLNGGRTCAKTHALSEGHQFLGLVIFSQRRTRVHVFPCWH
jgi:hypothetical protein